MSHNLASLKVPGRTATSLFAPDYPDGYRMDFGPWDYPDQRASQTASWHKSVVGSGKAPTFRSSIRAEVPETTKLAGAP